MRSLPAALLLVALAASSRAAFAEPTTEDKAGAQALFDEGKRLSKDGKWAEACPKFEESQRLDPGIGTQFKLADCFEHTGRTASAWANFLEAGAAAGRLGQADRQQIAKQRADALAPKLTKLLIVVTSPAPGLEVQRDGRAVGAGLWGTPVPIDPGSHVLRASAPGRQPWESSVDVRGEGATITATIPALAATGAAPLATAASPSATPAAPAPARPDATRDGGSTQRTVGLVIAGTGVAGVALGAIFGAMAIGKNNSALSNCEPQPTNGVRHCNPQGLSDTDAANGLATGSTVAFIVGVAAIGGGVALYLVAPKKGSPSAATLRLGPRGASVGGSF